MSFFGGLFNTIGGLIGISGQRKAAQEANALSYAQNLDFWNRQNAYNNPKAQMERFKAAGLNPNLIYGQTNVAGPISTPDVKVAEDEGPNLLDNLMKYQQIKMNNNQMDYISAQKDLAVEQAEAVKRNMSRADQEYALRSANFALEKRLIDARIREIDHNISMRQPGEYNSYLGKVWSDVDKIGTDVGTSIGTKIGNFIGDKIASVRRFFGKK